MRRSLIAAVAVGLLVASTTGSEPRLVDTDERAVTIATLPCERNLQATSSGYLIDDELVITVAHAVFESRRVAAMDVDGVWHEAQIVHIDLERDLAALRVPGARSTPATLALEPMASNDHIRLIGAATSGSVAGVVTRRVRITTNVVGSDAKSQRSGYELALPISVGDSGAAVLNDAGEVAAIVFAQSTKREGVSWATSAQEVTPILGRSDAPAWRCDRDFGRTFERS